MANSPAHRWENGVLVERAISTNEPGDPNEFEATTNKPYKTPVPTKSAANRKAVQAAENKSVAR